MEKINRLNIGDHLLDHLLSLIGKTMKDAQENTNWFNEWTVTQNQYDEFRKYAVALLKKTLKCNKSKAEYTFEWFYTQFGLKIKN